MIQTKKIFSPMKVVDSNISNIREKMSHPSDEISRIRKTNKFALLCKNLISGEIKKPEWRWNLNSSQQMCFECYERKSKEYEKINNYCNECSKKLGFIRYNPNPLWAIKGQLCRTCWDSKNSTFKK